ncbi:hypothetical protein EC957_003293 [Mortierella hygrophila]|uniref:RhoGAP-domain-containing protein n=1 Tax=Mortierella hygrophila TaxID=979708 RepID=A0A9P6F3R6_9FUNG|nr:hypothetical protein EC957_003293 [Mortierella hygrophila]
MTGDEAYHADCFRCTQCDSKIDDLVFAKTSQGIYCMKCHQERKEAKRQREERERMERAEKMMEKLLPTIPEGEKPTAASTYRNQSYEKHQQPALPSNGIAHTNNDLPRYPQPKLPIHEPLSNGSYGLGGPSLAPSIRSDGRPKTNGPSLPSLDVGPPLLPPLTFGLDDIAISSGGFDLGDMLSTPGTKDTSQGSSTISSPTPSAKEVEIVKGSDPSSYRLSISRASARLSMSSPTSSDKSSVDDEVKTLSDIPEHKPVDTPLLSLPDDLAEDDGMSYSDALNLVRELRLEVAKHNPASPLLHGTPQLHFVILKEKVDKLTQKHTELEKSIRDMYIEKDLLGMDLEAMNDELAAKEEASAANTSDSLKPRPVTHNFRLSTSHDLMKQSYQVEVKALQDQKELLQQEIHAFVETRDRVLDEMQILSVRNAELSTINNDMMRELQGRKDSKAAPAAPSSSFNLTSFTGKMRRQRQMSGGNQQELKAQNLVAGSNESTLSFVSTNSDGASSRSQQGLKSKKEDRQEDIFGEEIVAPKKFNWKKGTINTMNTSVNTVKTVGAMFGKLLVEGPTVQDASAANGRGVPTMLSDNGSSNGQILPPTRSFSAGSDSRSLNGQYTEQHFFIQHNYMKPTRCDCCDDKMWGREYKCRGCGFQIHGRCTHEIVPGCSGRFKDSDSSSIRNLTPSGESSHGLPSPSPKQVMFGNSLLDQLETEQRVIPMVVEKCIEAVDERGLEVEGIYRRSGMAVEARQLVQAFDSGLYPNLMDTAVYQDICSITSVLKQYLRTLPEPLIPYDLYSEFMEATGLPHTDDKYDTFKELMDRMPFAHYQTLKILMEHLNRVTELESINLMTSKNLSVVFGPTLMRNPDPSLEILDMTSKNLTIEFLIVNTRKLFVRVQRTSPSSHAHGQGLANGSSLSPSDGFPPGFTGQRQGSHGSLSHMSPPPRRVPNHAGHPNAPVLPPRSSSGDAIPTVTQGQQSQHYYQQQQQYSNGQHMYQQQQQQQQQMFRPQQFQQPQHPTLQQLKLQQQQRDQFQRDQQQQVHQQQQQQQQLQQEKHAERDQELDPEQEQEESDAVAPSSPPSVSTQPSSPLPSQNPSLVQQQQQQLQQQRQVNSEVDMTHFP